MKRLAAAAALLVSISLVPEARAGVRLSAEATPSERRPIGRIVFGVSLENDASATRGTLVVEQLKIGARRQVELPVELAAMARKQLLVAFDTQPGSQDFELRFESKQGVLAEALVRVPSVGTTRQLVGVFGPVPGWLRRETGPDFAAVELSPALLPTDARTWPDVDAILWPAPRTGELDERGAATLRDWVLGGGRLLVGTAADQPRALAELGLGNWPEISGGFERAGFGEAARSELDLARSPAPNWVERMAVRPIPAQLPWWSAHQSLFEIAVTWMMRSRAAVPEAPVWGVGLVLGFYLLLSGPGEWLAQRRATQRSRRSTLAPWRRPALLALAIGGVLVLAGGLDNTPPELVRIDLIDVELGSSAARARSYVALRRRAGGWMRLEAATGTHLSAGLGSLSGTRGQWEEEAHEPQRLFRAGLGADAVQHSVRSLPDQWATVTWRLAWWPDPTQVAAIQTRARTEGAGPTVRIVNPERFLASASESVQEALRQAVGRSVQSCSYYGTDLGSLADCAAASCESRIRTDARRTGQRRPDMEWPDGATAWIAVEDGSSGPELRVDGLVATGRSFTVWRVLLPEDPS